MSIALEVSFRGIPPSEALVAMAAEQYRRLRAEQPNLGDCLVLIEAVQGARRPSTRALVRFGAAGAAPGEQAEAQHRVPAVALDRALHALRTRLVPRGPSCERRDHMGPAQLRSPTVYATFS